MKIELGALVVDVAVSPTLLHLPAGKARRRQGRQLVVVAFDPADPPAEWETLCGLDGNVLAYAGLLRGRRVCAVCRERAPHHVRAPHGDGDEQAAAPRRRGGRKPGDGRRVTDAQLRALHRAYQEQELSVRQLAEQVWERLGYTSARSCAESLHKGFRQLELPLRDRIDAVRLRCTEHGMARKHGSRAGYGTYRRRVLRGQEDRPLCKATRQNPPGKGRPCRHRAMHGSDYCLQHDPDRHDQVIATVTATRALAPRHVMIPWADIEPHVRALVDGERHPATALHRITGVPEGTCSRLLLGRREHLSEQLAARLLSPLAERMAA